MITKLVNIFGYVQDTHISLWYFLRNVVSSTRTLKICIIWTVGWMDVIVIGGHVGTILIID